MDNNTNISHKPVVTGIGEALWDVLPEGKKVGGAPANFAYHVGQFGLDSCVASAVGHDRPGSEMIELFGERKLSMLVPLVDYPTGTVIVELDERGVPTYDIKQNVAWDNIPFTPELEALARRTRAVCFGSLAQRSAVSRETIGRFLDAMPDTPDTLKVFDINLRQDFFTAEIIERSMERCNVLKINDEELVIISRMFEYSGLDLEEKCLYILGKYNLKALVLTCGVNGSYVFTHGNVSFMPTPVVDVVDTVGAGDSFTAAFIASLLKGHTVGEAHRFAVEVSAYVCSCHGAMPEFPAELLEKI